jgi:hypothetical protein
MPKLFKSLVVLFAPLVLVGCKINSINYFPPTPAHIRVVNVLGTTTPINVAANGTTIWSNLPFEAMTGYQDFENTTTSFTVRLAGVNTDLVQQTYNPAGNQNYTLVIYGTTFAPSIGVMADVTQPPPSGKIALNLFNAAPTGDGVQLGTSYLDVYLTPPGEVLDNVSPVFTYIQYTNTNVFGQFDAGTYQMRMTIAGTKTVVYDSGPRTFQGETATDVIIYQRTSQTLVNVLLNDSDGAGQQVVANSLLARLKLFNAAFETGAVNQLINGVAGVTDLPYANASAYAVIPAGTETISFEASAAPGATIASVSNNFVPATDTSIFISGFAGATSAAVLNDTNSPPPGGFASVRFINASPNSAPFDVYANATLQVQGVANYTASKYVLIPADTTINLTFLDSATGAVVLTLANQGYISTQTTSVYVLGPSGALAGISTNDTP